MIVVLGDVAVDVVSQLAAPLVRGSDAAAEVRPMPGGSGANVAVWLAREGQAVTFLGRVGDDMFGRWLAEDLASQGVVPRLTLDRERRTGVIQVLVEPGGERTMVPDRGANAYWPAEEVPQELIAGAGLVHVVGYVLLGNQSRQGSLQAMQYAHAAGVPVSLDPSSHAPLAALGSATFWEMVGRPTILLPNRQEALTLTGAADVLEAGRRLQEHAEIVVIKLDRDGCLALQGDSQWQVPAPPAKIVNATGAGDAFNAAFLAAWLADRDVPAACAAAVRLGTHAATLPTTR